MSELKETTVVNIHGFEYVPLESHIEAIEQYVLRIADLEARLAEADEIIGEFVSGKSIDDYFAYEKLKGKAAAYITKALRGNDE